jgi:hypothetical protein
MFINLLIALGVIVIALIVIVAMRPAGFRVTRSATITGPPAAVFTQVNDLHRWQAWSPWAKLDPNAKNTYEGPPAGIGSVFTWSGNSKIGEGRMTITESRPNELVRFQLEFIRPFKATNVAEFAFKPVGNQTAITWTMSGRNNFISKAMGLVINFDKMIGGQFENGLAALNSVVAADANNQHAVP